MQYRLRSNFFSNLNEIYIEAMDDEGFIVAVDLTKDFDFMSANGLRMTCVLPPGK